MVSHYISYPKVIITTFILMILSGQVMFSQSKRITPPRAAIDISSIKGSEIIIEMDLDKGSTLQEVSKYFDISESTVTKYNKGKFKQNKIQIGEINLHIPASKVLSKPYVGIDKVVAPYCQLFYTVQKGENLFTIATKTLNKEIKVIQQLNNLSSTDLKVDQRLLIGYLQVYPIETKQVISLPVNNGKVKQAEKVINSSKSSKQALENEPTNLKNDKVRKNAKIESATKKEKESPAILVKKDITSIKQITKEKARPNPIQPNKDCKSTAESTKTEKEEKNILEDKSPETHKVVTKTVVAMWDKNGTESKSLYVLHNDARVGSTIQIYFPMLKSKVNAKVLGKIPSGTYNEDISLFVSPAVAKELGILDTKAHLVVSYVD